MLICHLAQMPQGREVGGKQQIRTSKKHVIIFICNDYSNALTGQEHLAKHLYKVALFNTFI